MVKDFLRLHTVLFVLCTISLQVYAGTHSCGTARLIQQARQYRENPALKQTMARTTTRPCPAESYYDSVYVKKTEHFQIFYTLDGPNRTTEEFIDTLAQNAEDTFQIFTSQLGMLSPLGSSYAIHYQQTVDDNLYPIEVLDIDQMRGTQYYIGGKCHGCFGVTLIDDDDNTKSELVVDNDFLYTPERNALKDTVYVDGKACAYDIADQELRNETHDYSYAEQWEKAIRVTIIHELYHAVQMRYLSVNSYFTYWFEASASGIEEVIAPDIDDYITALNTMSFEVGIPLDGMSMDYGAGILLLYLYNFVDRNIDKLIWESFNKEPSKDFTYQFTKIAEKKGLKADSLFHDFVTRLSFSGYRTSFIDSTQWICSDEKLWPDFLYFQPDSSVKPNLQSLAYEFYTQAPGFDFNNFIGKASLVNYQDDTIEIIPLKTTNMADSIAISLAKYSTADSVIWIFSRLGNQELPTIIKDSTLRAFPTPWRGGRLCFTPLPSNKNFIEIRNRRGDLISRESYEGLTHCLNESRVKELMTPGVYRFRAGTQGKTQSFIIIY